MGIDENSILTVSAHEQGTGKSESISITNDKGRLTKEEIERMVADAEQLADKVDEADKNSIAEALTEASDWLSSNDDADKDDLEEHLKDLQKVCDPIIAKVYQSSGGQGGQTYDDEEFEDL